MAQQTLNNLELGLSFRTKLNDNYDEVYSWLTGLTPITGIDIDSGSIDDTPVGATTPSSGAFTTLTATSMDSTPIGGTTPAAGTFSSLVTTGDTVTIQTSKTPATATDTGTTGQIAWDASYIYVCVATNTWVRSPLATW